MSKTVVFSIGVGIFALYLTSCLRSDPSPIVTIKDGKLQGRIGYSRDGKEYFEYLSIPYAEPPLQEMRYEPPVPLKKSWDGVRRAMSYPPFCLQMDSIIRGKLLGVEDCLFLNVFTHELDGKRPVLVFIHGGGFQTGSSNMYHPEYFMDEEIVLVTINYRLGPLGFMNLEDGRIRGNMGLKDQNLALKWIASNIDKFGGDPSQVTIFGESAGAASVEYHMLSPLSKGLFSKAILQSGAVTCPWAFSHNPKDIATEIIKNTECANEKEDKLVQCLKQIDPVKLVEPALEMMDPTNPLLIFLPSVETIMKEDTFLAENPRKILKSGKLANKVPIITGVTSGEGALRTARIDSMSEEVIPKLDKSWEKLAARTLYHSDADISVEAARKLRAKYFGSSSFTANVHEFKKNFTLMASDGVFFEPIRKSAMLHAKHGAPTYMYYYVYDATALPNVYSLMRAVRGDDWILPDAKLASASLVDLAKRHFNSEGPHEFGITHGADLLMAWNMEGWTGKLTGPDTPFSKSYVKMLVEFAGKKEPLEFNGVSWPKVVPTTTVPQYMLIGSQPRVISEPFTERIRFWETLKTRE